MKPFIFAILILSPALIFSQTTEIKIDSSNGYKLEIPNWLQIKEPGKENTFGGTLPSINGIENAILITAFPKSDFKSFEDFQNTYLTGNIFGKPTKFSKDHIWYGQKNLIKINNGVEQKVFILWNGKIYHDMFVLLETTKSFLWIQYVATSETYEINIGKFKEFMSKLNIGG